jgi:preprotein translocase subunit SecF
MFIVKYRKIFFAFSALLVGLSLYGMFAFGFNLSIDFLGGTITEVRYLPAQAGEDSRPEKGLVESSISSLSLGGYSIRPSGDDSFIIRTKELSSEEREALLESLTIGETNQFVIERQNTIGPIAGAELKDKAVKAIVVVVLVIVLFITFAFRKVSQPVSSWKYGLATIIALFHDVIIPTGIFVYLGYLYGLEVDLLFVGGLLAILGYSVHDTIVVFDRVRENLSLNQETHMNEEFETTVGKSVTQTMSRSINTSLTLLITLVTLYLIGSGTTKDFVLLLTIGVIAGTYSSIFLASPLLVTFHKLKKK